MVYHDLGYSTETIFTGVFKGILHFHRFFKAKNPSSVTVTLGALPPVSHLSSIPLYTGQQGAVFATSSGPQTTVTWASGHPSTPSITTAGLSLSPASEPFLKKLVDKTRMQRSICGDEEFLADNIWPLCSSWRLSQGCHQTILAMRPRLREITSLPTWCYCFLGYMAILTSDPATRDQLTYARLLIREAWRHGGTGWLAYDHAFRQQVALNAGIR